MKNNMSHNTKYRIALACNLVYGVIISALFILNTQYILDNPNISNAALFMSNACIVVGLIYTVFAIYVTGLEIFRGND